MKFLAAFATSTLAFLLVHSPACRAHVGDVLAPRNISKRSLDHHHHDRESTKLPEFPSTTPDYQEHTSSPGGSTCYRLTAGPGAVNVTVGQSLKFQCSCLYVSSEVYLENCPEWKRVEDVLHVHSRRIEANKCTATLEIQNISLKTPKFFTCGAGNYWLHRTVELRFIKSDFEGPCQEDGDCSDSYSCKDSRCDCPDDKPLHITTELQGNCHSVRKLQRSCWTSVQCQADDINAFCMRDKLGNLTEDGVCVCQTGYEVENGKCVCSDYVYQYVYGFSKRYRTVFYVLLATSCALILLGLIRVCVIYRRGPTRRMGCVVSTNNSDAQPIVTSENEKPKI